MDNFINVFKALSDKTRVKILAILIKSKQELCICEIMDALQLAQYNISKHIRELKLVGLVKEKREGRFVFYAFLPPKNEFMKQIIKTVSSIPKENILQDEKRLKQRLSLRINGKVVIGMKGKC